MSSTPPPTAADIHVALEALRDDAKHWENAAHTLHEAAARALAATLPPSTFSYKAQAVSDAYAALQAKMTALLGAGVHYLDDIAVALIASAAAYEADEAAHAHRLNHIY